jgi:tetratricopeptide (TPR) repeat protein
MGNLAYKAWRSGAACFEFGSLRGIKTPAESLDNEELLKLFISEVYPAVFALAAEKAEAAGDANNSGDHNEAIRLCAEALSLDPNHAMAYLVRGNAYYEKGDYDTAITDYSEAVRLAPRLAAAYDNRGKAYRDMGQLDKADEDWDAAYLIRVPGATKESLEETRRRIDQMFFGGDQEKRK